MDLPVASDTAETTPADATDIRGLAERAVRTGISGWALDGSRPGHRLHLELQLDRAVISTGVADKPRADLEANGIGDGRHGFELLVEPELLQRVAEFRLFGLAADGSRHRIPVRIARPPAPAPTPAAVAVPSLSLAEGEQLKAELAALTRQVQQLPQAAALKDILAHQAALASQVNGLASRLDQALAGMASKDGADQINAAQERMAAELEMSGDRVTTLEAWIARLEQRLGELPSGNAAPAPAATIDPWQKMLFATLAGALAGALLVSFILRSI